MNLQEMREQKKQKGYSNEELAKLSGVPLGTVQKVMSGATQNPRRKTLAALYPRRTRAGREYRPRRSRRTGNGTPTRIRKTARTGQETQGAGTEEADCQPQYTAQACHQARTQRQET